MEHVTHPPRSAPASSTQRLLTAAVGTPIIVAGIVLLSGIWFFLFAAVIFTWAAFEYVGIVRPRAPHAPLSVLVVLVPLAALVMTLALDPEREQQLLLALGALTSVGIGSIVLLARTPLDETLESLGILAFGLPYFAVPRYIDIVDALPVNALGRVMKHVIRATPPGAGTWDFEAMGYAVSKEERRGATVSAYPPK